LAEKYSASKLVVLEYHGNDELSNSKTEARSQWYAVQGFPTAQFDGISPVVGGSDKIQSAYEKNIQARLNVAPLFTISLSGSIGEQTGEVKATVTPVSSTTRSNLKLRWVIYEDNIAITGKYHRFVVRNILAEDQLLFQRTEPNNINKTFAINPAWKYKNLGLVVFVQDDKTKEVLQTAILKAGK
jgi:hypothetical protein